MEKSLCNGNLIFIGDFNIHVENENDSQAKWLMELFDSLNLEQHIREPTHDGGHTLDLLVTQKNNSFVKFDKVEECHFSDHKSIHFIISAKKPKPSRKTLKYRKTKNIDIEAFKRSIVEAEVSKKIKACASVNEKINVLSNTISNVLEAHAPQKVKSIVIRQNCKWYTDGFRKTKRERRKAERRWKKSRLEIDRQLYVTIKNKVNDMIKSGKRKYFKDKLFEVKGNCKELHKLVTRVYLSQSV
ncbi:ATP-dependent DNA helicase [Elysia marginata]|uniref:ATP-dependent DNA helicase n=1 Tax=Elysia marginata TaxID=1093978 RepID=A0AAV4H344_9GAST|nr:ATP-dependent DNA helicase [Elysia marginata]